MSANTMAQPFPVGTSRFTTAIGPHTDLTEGLADDQLVNIYGLPLLQAELEEEDGLDEAARNVRFLYISRHALLTVATD